MRLVNLAVDVPAAGLRDGKGVSLADNVKYTLGSKWSAVSATEQTFSAVADARHSRSSLTLARPGHEQAGVLASSPFTPPQSPQVFTTFLLGSKRFGYSLLPQVDAPESGPCKPSAAALSQAEDKARGQGALGPLRLNPPSSKPTLNCHDVVLGADGELISWLQPQDSSMHRAATAAASFLHDGVPHPATPAGAGGRPAYMFYPQLLPTMQCGGGNLSMPTYLHNPAGLYGMLGEALMLYYAYSGNESMVDLIAPMFDYVLANGSTPNLTHWAWPGVPYASSTSGDLYFTGVSDVDTYGCIGCGDGYGVIEPDKVGESGLQMLTLFKIRGRTMYRDAAIHFANILCRNFRDPALLGTRQSPWPFRVGAETNRVREDYSANIIGPIKLLDALIKMGVGAVASYSSTRAKAWQWMLDNPMKTNWWCAYFEDADIMCPGSESPAPLGMAYMCPVSERGGWRNSSMPGNRTWFTCNFNQYSPMETARYMMAHPELDPHWREHTAELIDFVTWALVENSGPIGHQEPGIQWGARAVSEQRADQNRMVSHTSRYASVLAMFAEKTHNASLSRIARRSWDWSSYMSSQDGRVVTGPIDQSIWFTDGYGDFVRNTMHMLAANASWAPPDQSHILRSSSVVVSVTYTPASVTYSVFDESSIQKLVLGFVPSRVLVDGLELQQLNAADLDETGSASGWLFGGESERELLVRHVGRQVAISSSPHLIKSSAAGRSQSAPEPLRVATATEH